MVGVAPSGLAPMSGGRGHHVESWWVVSVPWVNKSLRET